MGNVRPKLRVIYEVELQHSYRYITSPEAINNEATKLDASTSAERGPIGGARSQARCPDLPGIPYLCRYRILKEPRRAQPGLGNSAGASWQKNVLAYLRYFTHTIGSNGMLFLLGQGLRNWKAGKQSKQVKASQAPRKSSGTSRQLSG